MPLLSLSLFLHTHKKKKKNQKKKPSLHTHAYFSAGGLEDVERKTRVANRLKGSLTPCLVVIFYFCWPLLYVQIRANLSCYGTENVS